MREYVKFRPFIESTFHCFEFASSVVGQSLLNPWLLDERPPTWDCRSAAAMSSRWVVSVDKRSEVGRWATLVTNRSGHSEYRKKNWWGGNV